MTIRLKQKSTALLMSGTILMSGLFGFGGTYLANALSDTNNNTETILSSDNNNNNNNGNAESTLNLSTLSTASQTESMTIPEIAAATSDSVVEISTETVTTGGRMGQLISEGAGSGVIVSGEGYIATNNHVIDGASKITVRLKNGETYSATLVGRDTKTDLAVIKISANNLQAAIFGDSDSLAVGDLAVAIGNPLGELGGTVTEGIISALNRDIVIDGESMNLLQTSAAINPGNSGGGLFNAYSELIGIVNAKSSGSDIEGLGFAIPINTAKEVIDQIISYGYVQGRIDLGVTLIDISDLRTAMSYRVQNTGVYVLKLTSESVFQVGDRIISIDGQEVKTASEVKTIVDSNAVGDTLSVIVQRGNNNVALQLHLTQAKS